MLGGLIGIGIAAQWPAAAIASDAATRLTAVLDRWAALGTPAARLRALEGFDAVALPLAARLDLEAARLGCAIDSRLADAGEAPTRRYPLLTERAFGAPIDVAEARATLDTRIEILHRRAHELMDRLEIAPGTIAARFDAAFADKRWRYADNEAGRDRAVADMNAWLDAVRPHLADWLGPLPLACANVATRRLTSQEIAAGKGGYRIIPDKATAGFYVVDLKDIARRPGWTLRSVVHHELLPGHMVQLPIEAQTPPHPVREAYAGGYVEGWATYAEALAVDRGLFADDPAGELGAIHWLLFRAVRGRVDLALHADGWDIDRALDLWRNALGQPIYFVDFVADTARIMADPGIRLAEAAFWLKFERAAAPAPALVDRLAGGRRPAALFA
ncbi:DUF885 family protein [Hephaestia sp. GCM10023244]|uniref:DUF885 family protein n=1 Tax=unclassified Hephaestia TaxID=2631281 RepID=UPI002076FDE1|nr:DUF885 family protein [Hephaestia sp. MAHUQ-44]MCM8731685.1 DUF885 domain-containing protein [Hephaestia sp. MAHUQ-44]